MTMGEARSSGKRRSGAVYQILPAARAGCHVSSAAAPSVATVGRWPSRVSKARLSKALISLYSTTSTERLF